MSDYTEFGTRYTACEWCDWTSIEHTYDIADNGERDIAAKYALDNWRQHYDDVHGAAE